MTGQRVVKPSAWGEGQKVGIAEEVFANRDGEPVYVRVGVGLFVRSVLIPVQVVETDETRKNHRLEIGVS